MQVFHSEVHLYLRWQLTGALAKSTGIGFGRAMSKVARVSNDDLSVLALHAGVPPGLGSPSLQEHALAGVATGWGVGVIGDGSIIKVIIAFFQTPAGQEALQILIKEFLDLLKAKQAMRALLPEDALVPAHSLMAFAGGHEQLQAGERIRNAIDILGLLRNGTVGDALDLFKAIQAKDLATIRVAFVKLAKDVGFGADAAAIDEIIADVLAHDWVELLKDLAAEVASLAERFDTPPAAADTEPVVRMMAARAPMPVFELPAAEATSVEAGAWLDRHKDGMKRGMQRPLVRLLLHNTLNKTDHTPEAKAAVTGLLCGSPPQLTAEGVPVGLTKDEWKKILERVIPILKIAGAMFPPYSLILIVVAYGLQWIVDNKLSTAQLMAALAS